MNPWSDQMCAGLQGTGRDGMHVGRTLHGGRDNSWRRSSRSWRTTTSPRRRASSPVSSARTRWTRRHAGVLRVLCGVYCCQPPALLKAQLGMPTGAVGPTWVTRIRPRRNPRGIRAALHYGTSCADTPCGNVQCDVAHAALATRRGAGWAYYAQATRRSSASRSAAPDGADTPAKPHEFCDCAEWLAPAR